MKKKKTFAKRARDSPACQILPPPFIISAPSYLLLPPAISSPTSPERKKVENPKNNVKKKLVDLLPSPSPPPSPSPSPPPHPPIPLPPPASKPQKKNPQKFFFKVKRRKEKKRRGRKRRGKKRRGKERGKGKGKKNGMYDMRKGKGKGKRMRTRPRTTTSGRILAWGFEFLLIMRMGKNGGNMNDGEERGYLSCSVVVLWLDRLNISRQNKIKTTLVTSSRDSVSPYLCLLLI